MDFSELVAVQVQFTTGYALNMLFKNEELARDACVRIDLAVDKLANSPDAPDKLGPLVQIAGENGIYAIQPANVVLLNLVPTNDDEKWAIASGVRQERIIKAIEQESSGAVPVRIGPR